MQKRLLSSLPLLVAGLLGGAGQEIPGFFPGLRWLGVVLGLVVFPFLAAYLGYRASATTGKVGSGGQRGFQIGLIGLGVFLVIGAIDLLARWDALNAGNTFFPDWMAPGLLFLTVVFRAGLLCLVALSGGALGGAIADLTGPPSVPTVPLQHQAGRSLPLPPAVPQGYVRPPQHPRQASRLPPAYLPPGRSASLPPQRPASFPPPFPPTRPKRRRFAAGMVLCLLISFLLLEAGSLAVSSAVSGWWQNLLLSSTSAPLSALTWSGTQFVAVGESGTILTSPDGRTWTGQAFGTSQTLYAITWSGTQSVTVGDGGTILTSPDGRIWTAQTSGTSTSVDLSAVAWSGRQFVAVGNESTLDKGYTNTILTSPNGRTWTTVNTGTSSIFPWVA